MTTVPKDNMKPANQPPNVSSSAPQTGKGQVNIGPPINGMGPSVAEPVTGFGPGKGVPSPPAKGHPYTDKAGQK